MEDMSQPFAGKIVESITTNSTAPAEAVKMVPLKPTREMLEALANEGLTVDELEIWRRRYDAMLAAAPERGDGRKG